MAELYLGDTKISSGASGGGSYDDTELREKVADLELYKPVYVTAEEYEAMVSAGTIDQNQMYAITDIADQNDIADLAKMADITAALETLQSDLRSTADEYYVELSADLNSLKSEITTAKSTAVSEVQSQQTTSVSAVSSQQTTSVNAVKSQQNSSVNAVNSAQTTAVNAVNMMAQSGVDAQPTIRPVYDMSELEAQANQINGLLDAGFIGVSADMASSVSRHMGAARNNQNGGTTTNSYDQSMHASNYNTFNITSNNPKEVANEVSKILQNQINRRETVWAQ